MGNMNMICVEFQNFSFIFSQINGGTLKYILYKVIKYLIFIFSQFYAGSHTQVTVKTHGLFFTIILIDNCMVREV